MAFLVTCAAVTCAEHTRRLGGCECVLFVGLMWHCAGVPPVPPCRPGGAPAAVPSFALRVQELFRVLTDRLHKSAFKLHVDILRNMFRLVEMGVILAPLGDPAKDNRQFVREFVAGFLMESFPHLAP